MPSSDEDDEWFCVVCMNTYNSKPNEKWVKCSYCEHWALTYLAPMVDFYLSVCIASLTVTCKLLAFCENKIKCLLQPYHSVVTTIPNIGYDSNKQKCFLSAISWTK